MSRAVLAVVLAGLWVCLFGFVRNLFTSVGPWVGVLLPRMGLVFPSKPVSGVVWSFLMAGVVYAISRRFNLWQTAVIAWTGYVLMLIVFWNLVVPPVRFLLVAAPFTFVEALGAASICRKPARLEHSRPAEECAKLDRASERKMASQDHARVDAVSTRRIMLRVG